MYDLLSSTVRKAAAATATAARGMLAALHEAQISQALEGSRLVSRLNCHLCVESAESAKIVDSCAPR